MAKNLRKKNIQKLALAMSLKIKAEHVEDKPVVIGYDRRFLSKEAVIWSCEILGSRESRCCLWTAVLRHRSSCSM